MKLVKLVSVHVFDIWTSKKAENWKPWVFDIFDIFDFQMCWRHNGVHFFRHVKFQKCSETVNFWHFWLGNVLRATTAGTFWTSQLPKVVWEWCALYILTWQCASRRRATTACYLFISHLAIWLRTCRFSEPPFQPPGATNHWKNRSETRLSYLSVHLHLLSSHSFSISYLTWP